MPAKRDAGGRGLGSCACLDYRSPRGLTRMARKGLSGTRKRLPALTESRSGVDVIVIFSKDHFGSTVPFFVLIRKVLTGQTRKTSQYTLNKMKLGHYLQGFRGAIPAEVHRPRGH